jgi:neutral trehalase
MARTPPDSCQVRKIARLSLPLSLPVPKLHSPAEGYRPAGWAPTHWMTVQGFDNFGLADVAWVIRSRWA